MLMNKNDWVYLGTATQPCYSEEGRANVRVVERVRRTGVRGRREDTLCCCTSGGRSQRVLVVQLLHILREAFDTLMNHRRRDARRIRRFYQPPPHVLHRLLHPLPRLRLNPCFPVVTVHEQSRPVLAYERGESVRVACEGHDLKEEGGGQKSI